MRPQRVAGRPGWSVEVSGHELLLPLWLPVQGREGTTLRPEDDLDVPSHLCVPLAQPTVVELRPIPASPSCSSSLALPTLQPWLGLLCLCKRVG